MKRILVIALLGLAACGAKGPLKWPEQTPAPVPAGMSEAPTGDAMLEPPPQASPERVDDPVRRSQERGEDEFDLPPPGA